MSDIVKACDISRGGLYRYYQSTFDIFKEVLQMEEAEIGKELITAMKSGQFAPVILEAFLQKQKEELLHDKTTLTVAIYEFFFMHKKDVEQNLLQKRFEQASEVLTEFIQYGIDRKEFNDVDRQATAEKIILLLEGIRISSKVMQMTEKILDKQLGLIWNLLVREDHIIND